MANVTEALFAYGHNVNLEVALNGTLALCVPDCWPFPDDKLLVLFNAANQNIPTDDSTMLILVDNEDLSEIALMTLLHKLGIEKGAILHRRHVRSEFVEIVSTYSEGKLDDPSPSTRIQRPWPVRPQALTPVHAPLCQRLNCQHQPSCVLDWEFP